jgi:ribokinase
MKKLLNLGAFALVLLTFIAAASINTRSREATEYNSANTTELMETGYAAEKPGLSFEDALNEKLDVETCLQFSNIVGALTTTKMGAQDSLPYRNEVESFKKRC